MEFLVRAGMPESLRENVEIKSNGSVSLKNTDNAICLSLIANIHNKVEFGRKLFCNGFIALTPEKEETGTTAPAPSSQSSPSVPASPSQVGPTVPASPPRSQPSVPTASLLSGSSSPSSPPQPGPATPTSQAAPPPMKKSTSACSMLSLPGLAPPDFASTNEMVRRYSLSLSDRPPTCSIAADIMNTRKHLLSEIQDLNDQLSEFGSCLSEQSDSSDSEAFKEVKRHRSKRKAGKSPIKSDEKLKKPSLVLDWYENCEDGLTH